MAIPDIRVEVGFDLTDAPSAPFFKLDDATQGRLDNTEFRLGGELFVDISNRVRNYDFGRGRAQTFSTFPAGQIDIELNNHDRAFDPLNNNSPFAGNIIPQRELRVFANDLLVFTGAIDDWDLSYTNDGNSTATIKASETIAQLNRRVLPASTPPEETAGERITRILNSPSVAWGTAARDIDLVSQTMGAYPIEEETSALEYMQNIALSEPGNFFMSREGKLTFRNRQTAPTSTDLVTFGDTGVPFDNVRVMYGSELLFNQIRLTRFTGGTVTVNDVNSQDEYGISEFSVEDMQLASDDQMVDIALQYVSQFSEPEYRFEAFDVYVHKFDETTQSDLLALDIGSVVQVRFTPNNIGDEIVRFGEVIRVDHVATPDTYLMTFGLSDLLYAPIVLDDPEFGRLDVGTLSW